jgi:hypothetical protein
VLWEDDIMEGGAPNLEKLYEQKISKKLSYSMQALLGLYKPRDRQLVGLMNKAVIPPLLVQSKNWYQRMIRNAKDPNGRFKKVMLSIYRDMISPLVDMFTPYPVPIDTLLKESATDQGEINVFGLPEASKRRKRDEDEDYEDKESDAELAKLELEMKERVKTAFKGPDDLEDDLFSSLGEEEENEF